MSDFFLLGGRREDRRTVLRALVVTLTHPLRRIVVLPEVRQDLLVGDHCGIEDHQHDFGVTRTSGARLFVRRVGREAARITRSGRVHAGKLPELLLGAPETTHPYDDGLQFGRKRRRQRMPVDVVRGRNRHFLLSARECVLRRDQRGFCGRSSQNVVVPAHASMLRASDCFATP